MSCIHIQVPQGSKEWFDERCGAITASKFFEVRKRLKSGPNKGGFSKDADDYAFKLATERLSGMVMDEPDFDPWQARRGREMEPEARRAYESRRGVLVQQTGLALTEDKRFGASVDGLVDDDGNVEIKCYLSPSKLKGIILDGDLSDNMDQLQGGLWITGRDWADFALYCPALEPVNLALTVIRVDRDDDYIEKLEADLWAFDGLVNQYMEKINQAALQVAA